LLSSNTSFTCPYNMMNFRPLVAEILSLVWSTPANFNGFRVLAAYCTASSSVRQPNFAALNRGRYLCSAGRPSRWALAHISSSIFFLASSQLSQIGCLPYFHTWCGLSANLGCRFETCCRRLAENTGHKKSPKNCHVGTIT